MLRAKLNNSFKTTVLTVYFVGMACSYVVAEKPVSSKMRTMQYQSQSPEKAVIWQKEVRSKLFDAMKMSDLVSRKETIPFNTRPLISTPKENYVYKELEINTTANRRMPMIVTIPTDCKGPMPTVVVIHGHGSGLRDCYKKEDRWVHGVGTVLADSGYITACVEVSRHEVYEEGRTLMGERLWDLMRVIDYLESMPEVDMNKLGVVGLSLGGEMTMWLGAMDTRVCVSMVCGFLTTMDHMEENNHCMCWKFPGLRELVDYADIYCLSAPRPLLFQNGVQEPESQFPPSLAIQVLNEIRPSYEDFEAADELAVYVHTGRHEVNIPCVKAYFNYYLK